MSNEPNKRAAAIQGYRDRQEQSLRDQEALSREEQERLRRREMNGQLWSGEASQAIFKGVTAASNDFTRLGSLFLVSPVPRQGAQSLTFKVHASGSIQAICTLTFTMDVHGLVQPATTARGVSSFAPVRVDVVTPQWAEEIAEAVLIDVLNGQRMSIPPD